MVLLPFVVGILLMLLSILFMVAIFLLCYTWAQYFLGNLNNLVAPAASSSSQPPVSLDDETSTVNQIILDPAILQSIIFKMKLHEVLLIKTFDEQVLPFQSVINRISLFNEVFFFFGKIILSLVIVKRNVQ
jgi:hypothetical protein